MKFYLVVRQFIIYGLLSRAPGFQYSLVSLKEITDSDTCPFGSIALSMKENFTVFVPSPFLFLFEFSLRWEQIRVSRVVGVVSGMGLLLLILQALGCVGDVWLVVGSAKRTFFLWGGPQFESSSSIGRIHDLIGFAAGSNMIGLKSARN